MPTKQKTTQKSRKPVARKQKKKSSKSSTMTVVLIGLISLLVVALFTGVAGWMGYEAGKEKASKIYEDQVKEYKSDLKRLRKRLEEASNLEKVHKSDAKKVFKSLELSEIDDYIQASKSGKSDIVVEKEEIATKKEIKTNKPKLVIIIDDIASKSQLNRLKSLPWKITPSIFPPNSNRPNTSKIALNLRHYMIHLPMEALNHRFEEDETLRIDSSQFEINLKVKNLRKQFPKAIYINNHTGSRFTSDVASMEKFFLAIKEYGFHFIDSKTTPKTVVPKMCKRFNEPYLARDIFLDNKADIGYIKNQLKKAVKIAKKHGYAIAIGHPHSTTFKALANSESILRDVDVVYIDELYKNIK